MQHMELSCYLLRKQVTERGDVVGGPRVVVVDTYWPRRLETEWKKYSVASDNYEADKSVLACFDGRNPATMGLAWAGADLILLPFNLKNKHWVAIAIDLKKWQVRVYDPDVHFVTDRQLPALVMCITHLIPVIMTSHPGLKAAYEGKLPMPFALHRDKGLPQNKDR